MLISPPCITELIYIFNKPHLEKAMCTMSEVHMINQIKMGNAAFVLNLGAGRREAADWKASRVNVRHCSPRTGSAICCPGECQQCFKMLKGDE